jgi:hypothetical protein
MEKTELVWGVMCFFCLFISFFSETGDVLVLPLSDKVIPIEVF